MIRLRTRHATCALVAAALRSICGTAHFATSRATEITRSIAACSARSGLDPNEWFPIPPNVGPYPGLVAFDEKDAGVFFGRKQEITEYLGILDTLRGPDRSQVLVISGASGSGKSSLRGSQVRNGLAAGGRWIRTIGPPATMSSVVAIVVRLGARDRGAAADAAVQPASFCSASHSMEPIAHTVLVGCGLFRCWSS